MKGLLVKDFKLIKEQKNFFFIIIAITASTVAFSDDTSFILGFLPFVLSMFTLSTISYDEFDNGNAFLFTLPISRTGYTIEKYCLALMLGISALVFATFLAIISSMLKGTADVLEIVMAAVIVLPVLIVIQAVMIPFHLKFGGEKGRLALIGVFGMFFIIIAATVKAAEMLGIDIQDITSHLPVASMGMMVTIMLVVAFIILLLSMRISNSIMNNKEF
ncbi:MAG: ABC-2 transporter permease [Lachnospiraceae bacterium]|nr:ABC-2 transporter permease [Lachnospiraceae bacterium]